MQRDFSGKSLQRSGDILRTEDESKDGLYAPTLLSREGQGRKNPAKVVATQGRRNDVREMGTVVLCDSFRLRETKSSGYCCGRW